MKQELVLEGIPQPVNPIKAAVIDDVFDDIKEGEIPLNSLRSFYQFARNDTAYQQASNALNFPSIDPQEIEEDSADYLNFLNFLWKGRGFSDDFKRLLSNRLFQVRFQKMGALEQICSNLEGLNIAVTQIGSDISSDLDQFEKNGYNLIFIDYYLGIAEDDRAIENAVNKINLIYSTYPEGKKPATVLMSSANVENKAVEFYEKAQIMARPRFYHKNDLLDGHLIKLITGILKKEFSSRDQLEKYGIAITTAAKDAFDTFKRKISSLSVEDFIFIQHTVLQADKQPLGEYLEWLFGAYWGHVLFEQSDLRRQAEKISLLYIDEGLIVHRQPSEIVSEMYMSALFESNLRDIEPHPAYINKDPEDEQGSVDLPPYLHLGDVFVSNYHKSIWMIINPQCDLERSVPLDRSIFILPGELLPIGQQPPDEESTLRTEFFRFNGICYRIAWKPKETISMPIKKIIEWKQMNACQRLFKLRLPFAIELQQALVSTFSRVGLPVPPPLTQPLKVEVGYWNDTGKKYDIVLQSQDEYCSRLITRAEERVKIRYMLTGRFLMDFKRKMISILNDISQELKSIEDANSAPAKALEKALAKIKAILDEYDVKFLNLTYVESKKDAQFKDVGLGKIALKRNFDLEAHNNIGVFLINIVDPESASN